jgi:hypothetical protein
MLIKSVTKFLFGKGEAEIFNINITVLRFYAGRQILSFMQDGRFFQEGKN